jgi:acyl-CoA synthetase (AMP-forming)/AMP-acid ligase II
MAVYKLPEIVLVDEFPLTETGKVQKVVLRDQFADIFEVPGA